MLLHGAQGPTRLADDGLKDGELSVALENEADVEDKGIAVVDRVGAAVLFLVDDAAGCRG